MNFKRTNCNLNNSNSIQKNHMENFEQLHVAMKFMEIGRKYMNFDNYDCKIKASLDSTLKFESLY